jgi:hypothetical protein
MALPTRRRDRGPSTRQAQALTPAVWEPFATLPWDADPLAQLRTLNLRTNRLLDELLGDWPAFPDVTAEGVSTPTTCRPTSTTAR